MTPAIRLSNLRFEYAHGGPLFQSLSLELPRTCRALLVGANGAGKSTLLRLLAGQHLLPAGALEVLGRSPFSELALGSEISLIAEHFPLDVDLSVRELLAHGASPVDAGREQELLRILGIDPAWRMNRVSEGQRRRVQILLGLRKPPRLLLLDEVTAHLDLAARADFLDWLRRQSEESDLTIVYATHVLDGLAESLRPTHLVFLKPRGDCVLRDAAELAKPGARSLYDLCAEWIRANPVRA